MIMFVDVKDKDRFIADTYNRYEKDNFINPLNILEQKRLFLSGEIDNPFFSYTYIDKVKLKEDISFLKNIKILQKEEFSKVLLEARENVINSLSFMLDLDSNKYNSSKFYGLPSKEDLEEAHDVLLRIEGKEDKKTKSASELKVFIENELLGFGIKGWEVVLNKNISSRMSVITSDRRININPNEFFSERDFLKLKVHEIQTHVFRAENTRFQRLKVFNGCLKNYIMTEEGLAIYNERQQKVSENKFLKIIAGRNVDVSLAQRYSFRDVFEEMRKYFSQDEAFKITERVKRGLNDTSKKGGHAKDYVYFSGLKMIERFVSEGGDLKKLYSAKIGIEHVDLVDRGLLEKARFIPDFLS